jgi:hypothetical protein
MKGLVLDWFVKKHSSIYYSTTLDENGQENINNKLSRAFNFIQFFTINPIPVERRRRYDSSKLPRGIMAKFPESLPAVTQPSQIEKAGELSRNKPLPLMDSIFALQMIFRNARRWEHFSKICIFTYDI